MLLVWQNSSRMEAKLWHGWEYPGQRALSLHVLAKILPCALQNGFWPIWAILAQTEGMKRFIASGGKGGARKEWPWGRAQGILQPPQGGQLAGIKGSPQPQSLSLSFPFPLLPSSGGSWMFWTGFRLPGSMSGPPPAKVRGHGLLPYRFPWVMKCAGNRETQYQFPSILLFDLIQDSRTVKHFSIVWPQSKFTFYYIDHIFSLCVYDHGQGEWENKERNKYVYMSKRNYIAH